MKVDVAEDHPKPLPLPLREPFEASRYGDRIRQFVESVGPVPDPIPISQIPPGYQPWWQTRSLGTLRPGVEAAPVDLEHLLVSALSFSPHIQAARQLAGSRMTAITEAKSEFDVRSFVESRFVRTSDPVGNTLTTGGPGRFRDQTWKHDAGVRKRNSLGGSMEVSQQFGFQDNNSEFLIPKQQGTSRLVLRFEQPLLNGAGQAVNASQIVLAQLDTRAAHDELALELTDQLYRVTEVYWDLYLRRTALVQKEEHIRRAVAILRKLEDRQEIDALQSQVLTARAAVAMRSADLNRARASVRNAESRIRQLVASPEFYQGSQLELLPRTLPTHTAMPVSLADGLVTAVAHRPEMDRAIQETRKAAVRLDVSRNELLPAFNMVLEAYVAGLEGESRIDTAWLNQFRLGEPGYTAGLLLEVPWGNRAARSRYQRRQFEWQRVTSQLRATVDQLMTEVDVAVRDMQSTYADMCGWYRSMEAAGKEVKYLEDRWLLLPGDDRSASFLLEDLLKSQDRLSAAEFGFAQAQHDYCISLVRWKRVIGTLLEWDRDAADTANEAGL